LLGQEGFPSAGVWRVRDVNAVAEQWRFGGAPENPRHTRILDLLWPTGAEPSQETYLSRLPPTPGSAGDAAADDLPQVPMLRVD
jgi:hypothetical protein